ncbi:MAG: DUF2259 domain-containing protein [Mesorhizobium sp.]
MIRLCALAVAAGLASAAITSPATAGDIAQLDILGFSADGKIFAFEEYGTQDGSGFPYANRFYIDTARDEFLANTPIRVRLDDEAKSVADARAQARAQGQTIVTDATLDENRGYLAGFNSVTELSAATDHISVNPRPVEPAIDQELSFRLEQFELAPPAGACDGFDGISGFRLLRSTDEADEQEIVHEDKAIPQSRRCPTGYRLSGVQTFYPKDGPPVYAVIVAVRSVGFEGPDYRFIALTGNF